MNIVDNLLLVPIFFINLVKFKMIQLDAVLFYNCILFGRGRILLSCCLLFFFHLDYITTTTVNYEGLGIAELQPAPLQDMM